MIDAVDCQSFAGGFTLGMARAGFNVVAKREGAAGFGVPIVDYNRNLINPNLEIQAAEPADWVPRRAKVVFGNPPCSGFSGLTGVSNRTGWGTGADHAINQCMWDLVAYAAACKPDIVVMESVQLAYKNGRDLMQQLRHEMEERTGKNYDLVHVLHNNAAVGGASIRRRYFMVMARRHLKFGIEPPVISSVPVVSDLLYDLETMKLDMAEQKYKRKAKPGYPASLRNPAGVVDGHQTRTSAEIRAMEWMSEVLDRNDEPWAGGEKIGDALRRAIEFAGFDAVPDFMKRGANGGITHSLLSTHAYCPRRAHGGKAAGVVTGTGAEDIVHPSLPRTITYREAARIMGFPDAWSLAPLTSRGGVSNNQKWLGKGISVPCGEWIGGWVRKALEREPGTWRGTELDRYEYVIDVTSDHKAVYDERTGERRDSRSKDLRKAMEARVA
jgi:site-specific DNA-cytosine methylase